MRDGFTGQLIFTRLYRRQLLCKPLGAVHANAGINTLLQLHALYVPESVIRIDVESQRVRATWQFHFRCYN
jgi:hypothetical protein